MALFVGSLLKTVRLTERFTNAFLKTYTLSFDTAWKSVSQSVTLDQKYSIQPTLICLTGKAGSLVQYINMQGHQKIKDIIAALTDRNDPKSLKTLQNTLDRLLKQQYLRAVNWWNLMPSHDLTAKITLEEEKKTRGEKTTSASLAAKEIKSASVVAERRIKNLAIQDKRMEGVKRKLSDKISPNDHRGSK